ncbi:hypothetical protein MKZ38_008097 [Zalerion maritima]|uniref:Uncharacterized protein n=1 Tax=Zalerion maritima TaxID=339359 RepID=A0AAD5WVA3_9PEZI|nr:hypothetical protein MKZ38_008097 [Zalerion maritima]
MYVTCCANTFLRLSRLHNRQSLSAFTRAPWAVDDKTGAATNAGKRSGRAMLVRTEGRTPPSWRGRTSGFGIRVHAECLHIYVERSDCPQPCSYCTKTNKRCTIDWARAQQAGGRWQSPKKAARRSYEKAGSIPSWSSQFPVAGPDVDLFPIDPPSQIPETCHSFGLYPTTLDDKADECANPLAITDVDVDTALYSSAVPPFDSPPSPGSWTTAGLGRNPSNWEPCETTTFNTTFDAASASSSSSFTTRTDHLEVDRFQHTRPRRHRLSSGDGSIGATPWGNHRLATHTNSLLISDNLMRIYHDVLEGALSCWVTEQTCPYKMPRRAALPASSGAASPPPTSRARGFREAEHMGSEWGPNWSNRIYRRAVKLDQAALSVRLVRMTPKEQRNATRALSLAVMAFATQWAQASQRWREQYPLPRRRQSPAAFAPAAGGAAEEFDRTIQRSLWNLARSALQDCAELDSFKVACAEIILGFSQRPWDEDEGACEEPRQGEADWASLDVFPCSAVAREIDKILLKDGPPIFLERAARRMHTLKYQFDKYDAGTKAMPGASSPTGDGDQLDEEDRRTVGLLYWMALMFDTVSSATTERPLVVSDEDCQEEQLLLDGDAQVRSKSPPRAPPPPRQFRKRRMWNEAFVKDDPASMFAQTLRWPCSYEAAARGLADAAPVKVLFFRHVKCLQDLVARGVRGQGVEDALQDALSVQRYWNATFGSFFRDCVADFASLPRRIQSWLVCLAGHWGLGALLLSDLVEVADSEPAAGGAGGRGARARAAANLVESLRSAVADDIAKLAGVSTPGGAGSSIGAAPGGESEEVFHSAVSETLLLTEPWTIMLIRAFSKAAVYWLGRMEDTLRSGEGHDHRRMHGDYGGTFNEVCQKCSDCVKALWFLGKKSDMARRVYEVLARGMTVIEQARGVSPMNAADLIPPSYEVPSGILEDAFIFDDARGREAGGPSSVFEDFQLLRRDFLQV